MMMGEKDKALQIFGKVGPLAAGSKSSFDAIVIKQAKRYLNNGGWFAAFELLYLRRDLAKMVPIMAEVVKALDEMAKNTKALEKKQLPQQPSKTKLQSALSIGGLGKKITAFTKKPQQLEYSFDDRAAYLLLKGSMVKALGKNDEAIEMFKEAIDMTDFLVEKLYAPYCLYELAECYYIKGQLKEAEENFKKCSKFSGFEWEDPLRVRLRVTMDQLKKGTTGDTGKVISIDSLANNNSDSAEDDKEPDEKDIEKMEEEQEEEGEDKSEEDKDE
jgi:tetratricopeptide (TPR) repeat protein